MAGLSRSLLIFFEQFFYERKCQEALVPFQELSIEGITDNESSPSVPCDIEVHEKNKVIKFRKVDLLVEYLKKVS